MLNIMVEKLEDFDVVIVGGGPSGANTAISYKKLSPNLKIAVFDKASFPRDKSCGDAIGPGVINALKRFGNEDILENEPQVVSTTLFGPDDVGIQNYIPQVKNKEDSVVYVIPRLELDNRILDKAKNLGVKVFENFSFFKFEVDQDIVLSTFKSGEKLYQVKSKLLIGADGANSRVRNNLKVKSNSDKHKAIAIRAYIDSPNYLDVFKERTLMFEINVSAEKGYAWAFPSRDKMLNIGIGVPLNIFKKDSLNLDELLKNFVDELNSRGVVTDNIRLKKSYLLPFASFRPKIPHPNRVALVGDASSMINPMSGEGIFYGMEAGYLLAKNTINLINSEKINQGIKNYYKEFNKRFNKHYLSCTLARLVLQVPFMTKRLLKVASKDQNTIDFVVELLFDEAHLTLSEVLKLTLKFLLPQKLLLNTLKN